MFEIFSIPYFVLLFLSLFVFLLGKYIKDKKAVYKISFILFAMEIFKQIYLLITSKWSIWYIPFQLCSMPLYLFIFKNTFVNKAYLKFIKSYSLLSGIGALIYPMDMISHGLILCIHSYIWHYLIILMASIIYYQKLECASFLKATLLFIIMCIIATAINIGLNSLGEINMFYIYCLIKSYQPIVKDLELVIGRILVNVLYLLVIIGVSYIIDKIENLYFKIV